ncbi:MAG: NAD-dependent epimerase/dehydratase family protein, partial [Propylenella sp.]
MIVAVTGATGYAGQYIVRRLLEGGAHVRAWRRASSNVSALLREVEWIEGGLTRPETAAALVKGADALVHAALDHAPGLYRGGEGSDLAGFIERNVGGSLSLLLAARKAEVERCIFVSTRAVFGVPEIAETIADDEPP